MKKFSMVKLFTICCLLAFVFLLGKTTDVCAEFSLEVSGEVNRIYSVGDTIEVTFFARNVDAGGFQAVVVGVKFIIESGGLSEVTINGISNTNEGTTDIDGRVTVRGKITMPGWSYVKATWAEHRLEAWAEFYAVENNPTVLEIPFSVNPQWNLPEGAKARLGKGSINEIKYSPDGTKLAVASSIGIWIYAAQIGVELDLFTGHTGLVRSVAFSSDGNTLASGSDDRTIRLWNANTGANLRTLTGHTGLVRSVAFSPDGTTIASGSDDRTIRLWNANTGAHLRTLTGHTRSVYSVAFSPDGTTIASGSWQEIRLWNANTGTHLRTLTGHTHSVSSVAFSPDGDTIASGSWDDTIRLWNANTGTHLRTLTGHTHSVSSVAFSPDGDTIASGSWDDTIRLWNANTGTHLRTLTGHTNGILSVAFSPDGTTIASGSWDNTIRLWNANTGAHLRTLTGHTRSVYSVAFSPDGTTIASGSWQEIRLWNANTGTHLRTLTGHTHSVSSVAFSPDGDTIASGSWDDTIRLWNANTGTHIRTLTGHTGYVFSVVFSPDRDTIASGSGDNTIRLWNANTGTLIRTLSGHTGDVDSVAFSPDGDTIASGSNDDTIRLWNANTGNHLRTLTGHTDSGFSLAFSPNGSTIASGSDDRTIRLWDANSGRHLRTLTGHTHGILSVAFSPDGTTIASGSYKEIRLWDINSGKHLRTLTGHTNWVYSVAFSPDGTTIASGSGDGTVLLWEVLQTDTVSDVGNTPDAATPLTINTPLTEEIEPGDDIDYFSIQIVQSGQLTLWTTGNLDTVGRLEDSAGNILHSDDDSGTDANFRIEADVSRGTYHLRVQGYDESETGEYTVHAAFEIASIPEDVNGDGEVNILDLTFAVANFGATGTHTADVNSDGVVDIVDLVLVAAAFGNIAAAPHKWDRDSEIAPTGEDLAAWLHAARQRNLDDPAFQRGIAVLESLLKALTPKTTALLPNYPNPFNPETWIPYQLAKESEVTITIHATDGTLVRTLSLGLQTVGLYQSKSRAVYWDGKNEFGERVASGIYFYTLTAGPYSFTGKMLIRK